MRRVRYGVLLCRRVQHCAAVQTALRGHFADPVLTKGGPHIAAFICTLLDSRRYIHTSADTQRLLQHMEGTGEKGAADKTVCYPRILN